MPDPSSGDTEVPEDWNLSRADAELMWSLPVCGCGNPELAYDVYRRVLASTPAAYGTRAADEPWPTWEDRLAPVNGDETLFYVVAGVLDSIGATEHGGSIGGAWRTDKGERLLLLLTQHAAWDYEPMVCYDATGPGGVKCPVWSPDNGSTQR